MRWAIAGLMGLAWLGVATAQAQPVRSLEGAVEALFSKPEAGRSRAVLVLQDGKLIVERYAPGYTADTRFVSWSVAKTVTALAIGRLVEASRLQLDMPAPVPSWKSPGDARGAITLRHLLTMTAGLEHREFASAGQPAHTSDPARMLFADGATDTVAYATAKPLVHPPGKHWQYSSATTQILADIVARTIAPNAPPSERRELTAAWFQREFWQPLGITSAEFDFDQAGTFLGCCLLHMTARDWARLGEALQARKPAMTEAWFATMTTPSRAANDNHYGGQLWLNTGPAPNQPPILFHPRGGTDTIAAVGHHGQFVIAVPAKRAVVVRLGLAVARERGPLRERLGDLIEAIPAP